MLSVSLLDQTLKYLDPLQSPRLPPCPRPHLISGPLPPSDHSSPQETTKLATLHAPGHNPTVFRPARASHVLELKCARGVIGCDSIEFEANEPPNLWLRAVSCQYCENPCTLNWAGKPPVAWVISRLIDWWICCNYVPRVGP